MFARIGVMQSIEPDCLLDVPRTENTFQKWATSFQEEQMGYLTNALTNRRRKTPGKN
jgi:hypothetical protein